MTDYEKSQIRQLQEKGYGYKKIATTLSLSVNAVKGYMRRNNSIEANSKQKPPEGVVRLAEKPLCKYPMDGHGGSAVPNAVPSGGIATWIRCSGRHTIRWYVRIVGRSLSATAIRSGYTAPENVMPWHGARGRMGWMNTESI